MPLSMPAPHRRVKVEPLTQQAFAPFGTCIVNPQRTADNAPTNAIHANQGTALKYVNVSHLINYYTLAPSRKPAKPVMNMFVCSPRVLRPERASESSETVSTTEALSNENTNQEKDLFDVNILERHPFTPQTFIPLGVSPDDHSRSYLVIVAPTLPSSAFVREHLRASAYPVPEARPKRSLLDVFTRARPSPFTNEAGPTSRSPTVQLNALPRPKGPGLPDLAQIRAFIVTGDQAVTYAAGTWHAPMVVLGSGSIDFVVVQYANGVGLEDCQEVELQTEKGREGVVVEVDGKLPHGLESKAKL